MDEVVGQFVVWRPALTARGQSTGLPDGRFRTHDDVTPQRRIVVSAQIECDHVGGRGIVEPLRVDRGDPAVVDHDNAQFSGGHALRSQHGAGHRLEPPTIDRHTTLPVGNIDGDVRHVWDGAATPGSHDYAVL